MAHELAMVNGQYQYIGRSSGWHNLGTVKGSHLSLEDIRNAGILYNVQKVQLTYQGVLVPAYGIIRTDTGDFICQSTETYEVRQHTEGFEMLTDLLGETKTQFHFETAGVLKGGRVVWGLIDLNEAIEPFKNDTIYTYLLFTTSHDGSLKFTIMTSLVRVVCNNTLNMALNASGNGPNDFSWKISHTKNMGVKIDMMKQLLSNFRENNLSIKEKFEFIGKKRLTEPVLRDLLFKAFPGLKSDSKSKTQVANQIKTLQDLFVNNDGLDGIVDIAGSAYNMFNGITEYKNHFGQTKDVQGFGTDYARSESALFGTGNTWMNNMLDAIVDASADLPDMNAQAMPMEAQAVYKKNWLDIVDLTPGEDYNPDAILGLVNIDSKPVAPVQTKPATRLEELVDFGI